MSELSIIDLYVSIGNKEILKGVSLNVAQGQVHAIMGPNGTGKSTLAYTLMGHPGYEVTKGNAYFKGKDLLELKTDERSSIRFIFGFPVSCFYPRCHGGEFPAYRSQFQKESGKPRRQRYSDPAISENVN